MIAFFLFKMTMQTHFNVLIIPERNKNVHCIYRHNFQFFFQYFYLNKTETLSSGIVVNGHLQILTSAMSFEYYGNIWNSANRNNCTIMEENQIACLFIHINTGLNEGCLCLKFFMYYYFYISKNSFSSR